MRAFVIAVALILAPHAGAAGFTCIAPFDEGSRYELRHHGVNGLAVLRYYTDDGLDLRAEMKAKNYRDDGKELHLEAANESMGLTLQATGAEGEYAGTLNISFSLEHAESLELEAKCRR